MIFILFLSAFSFYDIWVSQQLIKIQSQRKKIWKSFSIFLLKLNLDIEFDRSLKGTLEFRFEKKSDIQSHKFFVWPYSFFTVEKGEAIYWDVIEAKSMVCSSMESVSQSYINISWSWTDYAFTIRYNISILSSYLRGNLHMIEPCL